MIVRPSEAADVCGVAHVYADAVLHGFGTFEEVPPSPEAMARRRDGVVGYGLPHLVAEIDGAIAGFAYASPFRPRAAYRYTAEDSVYVHPDFKGRGVGRALLQEVIAACGGLGLRQLLAVIGDSDNRGSIALHRSLGFQPAGVLPAVGYKHDRWVDVVMMTLPLNGGRGAGAAGAPGLILEEPR